MTGRPTGLQLYGEVHQFLAGKGVQQAEFCRRTGITTALLANVRVASMPREETVERIRTAISLWPNVTPSQLRAKAPGRVLPRSGGGRGFGGASPFPAAHDPDAIPRVDRDPCPRCAVRRDIGCAHSTRAISSRIPL